MFSSAPCIVHCKLESSTRWWLKPTTTGFIFVDCLLKRLIFSTTCGSNLVQNACKDCFYLHLTSSLRRRHIRG